MTHCPWTPTAYLFPLMLLSFLISQIWIADCLSIPTIKMMHNCCILWMETLWTLKCLHSPICSSAVIYFPADNIQYTGTHSVEVSTTFITLISGHTLHAATAAVTAWTGGYAELPISFQVLVQISELQQLKKGAGAWLPVNGMHSCEKGRCRDPQSEHLWKSILIVLLLRQVVWSKCPATQKHVPGKSECSYWRWLRSLQSGAWKQKPQCLCIIMCYVLYKHPVKIFPTQESFHFSGRSQ